MASFTATAPIPIPGAKRRQRQLEYEEGIGYELIDRPFVYPVRGAGQREKQHLPILKIKSYIPPTPPKPFVAALDKFDASDELDSSSLSDLWQTISSYSPSTTSSVSPPKAS